MKAADIVGGLGMLYLGNQSSKNIAAARAARRAKLGLSPEVVEKSPMDKGVDWISSKLSGPASPATATPSAPSAEGGLWDRLQAGNIDQPGSEAYNRWGQGKTDGDAAELTREASRTTPTDAPSGMVTLEQQAAAPDQIAASIAAENERAQQAAGQFTTSEWSEGPSNPTEEPLPFASSQG